MTTKISESNSKRDVLCPNSPTNAHHWVLGMPSASMAGICKYCQASREFKPFEENVGFNNSPKRGKIAEDFDID